MLIEIDLKWLKHNKILIDWGIYRMDYEADRNQCFPVNHCLTNGSFQWETGLQYFQVGLCALCSDHN